MKIFLLAKDPLLVNAFKALVPELYFLHDFEDVKFRLPDYGPDLILVNDDVLADGEKERLMLEDLSSQIPIVLMVNGEREGEMEEKGWKKPFLLKPFSFEAMPQLLDDLFSQHSS